MPQITDAFGSYSVDAGQYFRQLAAGFRVTASLVCDAKGKTVGESGSSQGLGNDTDLALLVALRRQSEVILTSGASFRADEYSFPKQSDLAVLTRKGVEITAPEGQKLIQVSSGYPQAVDDLRQLRYAKIHVEYGVTGIKELIENRRLDALFLSSTDKNGVAKLAVSLSVDPIYLDVSDLCVGLVAWQTNRLGT